MFLVLFYDKFPIYISYISIRADHCSGHYGPHFEARSQVQCTSFSLCRQTQIRFSHRVIEKSLAMFRRAVCFSSRSCIKHSDKIDVDVNDRIYYYW